MCVCVCKQNKNDYIYTEHDFETKEDCKGEKKRLFPGLQHYIDEHNKE